jgi:hypothetical protein
MHRRCAVLFNQQWNLEVIIVHFICIAMCMHALCIVHTIEVPILKF